MAYTPRELIPAKQAESTQTTQYTAASVTAVIDTFKVTNTTGAAVAFSVNIVQSGGTASDANLLIDAKSIAAGETYTCPELTGEVLQSGSFISTLAGSATSLTIRCSGLEIT
jgi:hypothetical protein